MESISDKDFEDKYPGFLNSNKQLRELTLYDKYKRWFPRWFVILYFDIADIFSIVKFIYYHIFLFLIACILILIPILLVLMLLNLFLSPDSTFLEFLHKSLLSLKQML